MLNKIILGQVPGKFPAGGGMLKTFHSPAEPGHETAKSKKHILTLCIIFQENARYKCYHPGIISKAILIHGNDIFASVGLDC
mgnify:CR=1 FL=1